MQKNAKRPEDYLDTYHEAREATAELIRSLESSEASSARDECAIH